MEADDEAGERRKKRPRTSAGAGFPASSTGNDHASDLAQPSAVASSTSVASSDPQPQPEYSMLRLDPSPGLDTLNGVLSANISSVIYLSRLETTRAVAKATEIAIGQVKPIVELWGTFLDAASRGAIIQDGYEAFLDVSGLARANDDFLPLLKYPMPDDVKELLVKQTLLTIELKGILYAAAADRANWTEALPEVSSYWASSAAPVISSPRTPGSSSSTVCSGIYDIAYDMM